MTRKALWLLPASLAAIVASQWRDIARYVKIHQMSRGVPPAPPPAETSGADGAGQADKAGESPAERLLPGVMSGTRRCRR